MISNQLQQLFQTLYTQLPEKYQQSALQLGFNTYNQCIQIVSETNVNYQQEVDVNKNVQTNDQLEMKMCVLNENVKQTQNKVNDSISIQRETQQKLDQFLLQSNRRGQYAEQNIEQILIKYLQQFVVENTSKIPNAGDLQIFTNEKEKIILEVKNYTNTVPFQEVDKFYNNVQDNVNVKSGIFVSFGQKIAKKPNICVEKIQNGKIVCFVSNFGLQDIENLVYLIYMLNQINTVVVDCDKSKEVLLKIQEYNKKYLEYVGELKKQKKNLEKQLNYITQHLKSLELLNVQQI